MIKEIKASEFKELLKEEGLALVDVYGRTCGPCKALAQTLESIDFDYPFINIYKLCADDHKEFCKEYKILGVPVIFFIHNGEIKERHVGALNAETIIEIASKYLYE
ncbi:MAG: thioredoxin family protein [Eubacteriales bacterium]|nr:thioredoxin family protein [Eubacteriales bacterium]